MDSVIYEFNALQIIQRDSCLFARYDAGAHQIVMREDEITQEESQLIQSGVEGVRKVLIGIQRRLIDQGIDPHISNVR